MKASLIPFEPLHADSAILISHRPQRNRFTLSFLDLSFPAYYLHQLVPQPFSGNIISFGRCPFDRFLRISSKHNPRASQLTVTETANCQSFT